MTRQVNEAGLNLTKTSEGCRYVAYDDKRPDYQLKNSDSVMGTLTIGAGHTGVNPYTAMPLAIGDVITDDQANELLRRDVASAEAIVENTIKVPLTDNQFAALVDLAFNIGSLQKGAPTLVSLLNAGKYSEIPAQLNRFTKSGGVVVQGLVDRCARRAALWSTHGADETPVTSASITPDAIPKKTLFTSMTAWGVAIAGTAPLMAQPLTDLAGSLHDYTQFSPYIQHAWIGASLGGMIMGFVGKLRNMKNPSNGA